MSLRDHGRVLARRLAPRVMAERAARHEIHLRDRWGQVGRAQAFIEKHGDRVQAGPVTGMRYWAEGDAAVPKLSGTYEREIADWIEDAMASDPAVFIDFGAADGYYAVGIKRRFPEVAVHAFEASKLMRHRLDHIAALNNVMLDEAGNLATAVDLRRLARPGGVLLCDIEGGEVELFDPTVARTLAEMMVLVEVHEGLRPGARDAVVAAFASTHRVELTASLAGDEEQRAGRVLFARCLPR